MEITIHKCHKMDEKLFEAVTMRMGLLINMLSECDLFPTLDQPEDIEKEQEKRQTPLRILNYVDQLIPYFTAKQFQSHFRITPQTFDKRIIVMEQHLQKPDNINKGRKRIDTKIQLLAVLWLFATPDSYR